MKLNSIVNMFLNQLCCPICKKDLLVQDKKIICKSCNETYPLIYGIPVLITKKECYKLNLEYYLNDVEDKILNSDLFKKNKYGIMNLKNILIYTNGILYENVKEPKVYPIPDIPFKKINNENELSLLDIGCGWGRWTVSAANKGYNSIGIDLNLSWLIFAKKMAEQMNIKNCNFVCCDVLNLPIKSNTFDRVFSFSFLQHFSENNLKFILIKVFEIMKPSSIFKTLMLNKYSLRGLWNDFMIKNYRNKMLKKGRIDTVEDDSNFNCRYFSISKINRIFKLYFIIKRFENYSFFTQAQKVDLKILNKKPKLLFLIAMATNITFNLIFFSKYISDNLMYTLKKSDKFKK